ncbi:MAG: DUF6783 domain-containing protein [Blautia faecis]
MFCPNSIAVVRYGALIRAKSPTNCDIHLAECLFQTRSRNCTDLMYCMMPYCKINIIRRSTSE